MLPPAIPIISGNGHYVYPDETGVSVSRGIFGSVFAVCRVMEAIDHAYHGFRVERGIRCADNRNPTIINSSAYDSVK